MDTTKLIELLSYTLPAIITGFVAYYFFNLHTKNEEGRRRYLLNKDTQKDADVLISTVNYLNFKALNFLPN